MRGSWCLSARFYLCVFGVLCRELRGGAFASRDARSNLHRPEPCLRAKASSKETEPILANPQGVRQVHAVMMMCTLTKILFVWWGCGVPNMTFLHRFEDQFRPNQVFNFGMLGL